MVESKRYTCRKIDGHPKSQNAPQFCAAHAVNQPYEFVVFCEVREEESTMKNSAFEGLLGIGAVQALYTPLLSRF